MSLFKLQHYMRKQFFLSQNFFFFLPLELFGRNFSRVVFWLCALFCNFYHVGVLQVLETVRQSPFLVTMHYAFQTPAKLHLVLGKQYSIFYPVFVDLRHFRADPDPESKKEVKKQ
jgi:hypothetical protein